MFERLEALVRQLILGYFGRYIKDIQKEQLKITLWNEEVLLENVELIAEAFDYLRLPFALKQGCVGKLSIKIPWKKLGWDPVVIILEDVYICVSQRDDKEWCMDAVKKREYASKKAQLAAAELAKLSRRVCDNQTGKGYKSYITAKILEGIQVSIRNVHVLYRDTLSAAEEILFGLRFSSLTIMRQTAVGSATAKTRGSQVSKLIEVQGLELYCGTFEKTDDTKTENDFSSSKIGREGLEVDKCSSILAPLSVSVSLSVNRSEKLLNDVPQYTVNVELACLAMSIDEIQLQQILSLFDYMSLSHLRENYGRYRPWWSPLQRKLPGWQKAWWHYAQESVFSDIRRRLRKTSWKYLGERLNSRRKYVNLYKAKLKCLRHDQVIGEDVLRELEEMEKETDIDDILNYRAVAERELEDFLVNPSARYGSNGGKGWLNWLSYGMLGAGGTNDSDQFSGVISDDAIKDIYESTKFHPTSAVVGDSTVMDEIYFSSVKINVSEIHSKLRSMMLGHDIADFTLYGISIEGKVREKSSIISASVNSAQMLNPFNSQVVLITKEVNLKDSVLEEQQPCLNIKVDLTPPNCDVNSSVKVMLKPAVLFLDSEFMKNIMDFIHVLGSVSSQEQRIIRSLNGIADLNSRILSKIDCVLSSRKKIMWDIDLFNTVINIPWGNANVGSHNTVLDIAAISFTSKSDMESSASDVDDSSYLFSNYVGFVSSSIGDSQVGFQPQDLYDHFEIQINDAQAKLIMPSSATVPLFEKFCVSANLMSCIVPDEPVLKQLEVHVQVPSLVVHFSASIYGELMGLVSQFNMLLPPDYTSSHDPKSSGLKTSENTWFSIDAGLDAIYFLVNLEDNVADGCALNLYCRNLGIWYDQGDLPDCWVSMQAFQITACSTKHDWLNQVLCSSRSMSVSESAGPHNMSANVDGQNEHLDDGNSIAVDCIFVHLETLGNTQWSLQKYTICASDLDIHCYPFVVGQLVKFFDKIAQYGEADIEGRKQDVEDENSARKGFGLQQYELFNEMGSYDSADIPLDHFPFSTFQNGKSSCNLNNIVHDTRLKFSKILYSRDQRLKFRLMESRKMFVRSSASCNFDTDSLVQTSIRRDSLLVDLNLSSVIVHFHDSSSIIGTLVVPLAKSLITNSADYLDIVFYTEGVVFSSSWWSQIITEFIWGPLSSNPSPILNFHMKKWSDNPQNSLLEISFYIQHVSCMLPPEFLATVVGYFSLQDWSPGAGEQLTDTMNIQDSSALIFNFEIVDSNIIAPASSDYSEFLKVNIKQLSFIFSKNHDRTKSIPSACRISASKFYHRNLCLDFSGCDLSLCLLISEKDMVNPLDRCRNHILVASLSADVWVRIPDNSETDLASYPVCIMAMVNHCQVDIEEVCTIDGFHALVYVIDLFSLVGKDSKIFTTDVPHFLQAKNQMTEYAALLPRTSNIMFHEMRFVVRSLSLRLYQLKSDSTCSEIMAEAEMHFVCSLSLINGKPHCLDISFSSLALFSLLNSVVLAEFTCPGSGLSVFDLILAVSDHGENQVILSFPCLDVWMHLLDWKKVIDLLSSFNEKSMPNSGASVQGKTSTPIDDHECSAGDMPNHVAEESVTQASGVSTLTLEHVGLAVHFPALVSRDSYNTCGRPHVHKLPFSGCSCIPSGNQNCFVSISLQSRNSKVVADGKSVTLSIIFENLSGVLKLFVGDTEQTWPIFQLSEVYLESEVFEYLTENVHMNLLVRFDSMDLSFGNHILYLFQYKWFEETEEMSSFNLKKMDLKMQLRRFSLLLTDWKTSNGPLLEFLARNSTFWSCVTEDEIKGAVGCDLQVNYYNIDKVLWEPFLEPWKFLLSISRKQDERALFSGTVMTDINLESKTPLNLNLNESILEIVSRVIEMIKDAWSLMEKTENRDLSNSQIIRSAEMRRYAPYMLQNLTAMPLIYVCQRKLGADDLDVSPSKGVLQPGSSTLIFINESPEELLFLYRPVQSSDRLNDKQLLEAAHRYVTFQLEGASVPSAPISMDLVGRRYFEVEFSKSSHVSEFHSDANSVKRKAGGNGSMDAIRGFAIPVVIDVSVQRFTKLVRLYSTVVILNSTSELLEVRFDIPFGVAPKILGPIYPGQEFPLPIHLAESGCIRWRPLGDSYLWSEAYNISSIISQDVRIGFLRSFVCYPTHPNSEAFRCCISVNDQYLAPLGRLKSGWSRIDIDGGKQSQNFSHPSSNNLEMPRNRLLYQVMLTSPLVLKNYLMKSMSVTLEDAGVARTTFLSEVETSFYHIDTSHDFTITFQMHGYRPSTVKYPRAESFTEKAKFSGTKFSVSELVKFDSEFTDGPLYVTMEKVMDAVSGAREISIYVPFLLYNCTGFPLAVTSSANEMKGYICIIPSCYSLDEKTVLAEKKDGLRLICPDRSLPATGSSSETSLTSPDLVESGNRKVTACLFSPDPHSYSGEVMVKLSRYLPSAVEKFPKHSWSASFSMVPPAGSTSVLVPQPSIVSGYMLSVSAMAAPFSARTKIITFQPRYVIANACTKNLCYKQKGTGFSFPLRAGQHSYIQWMDTERDLLLSVRFNEPGWEWSGCFSPEHLGDTQLKVRNSMNTAVSMMRVEVCSADVSVGEDQIIGSTSGNSGTNLILLSDDDTGFMPFRIDNHSRERLRIYQPKCESFETVVHPYTSSPYAWDEPCYPHRLIVEVPGERVLGSYAIDDISAHSIMCLPATSEKPERKLLISVHSEGAIKVLSIIDSSHHVLNDLKRLHVPQLKDNGKQTQEYESFVDYKERFSVDLPFLGVSLMNSHSEELLFACAKNTKLNFVQSLDRQQFSLQIESLQIDNQLRATPYPVILSFNCGNKGTMVNPMKLKDSSTKLLSGSMSQIASPKLHEPVFSLGVAKWRNTDMALVSFESISLRMADFYLQIEQEIVIRLFEFCKTASSRLHSRVFQSVDSTQNLLFPDSDFTGENSKNVPYSARLDEKHPHHNHTTLLGEDHKTSYLLPFMVPIGAPWQQIHLAAQKQKKIYVELFHMGPIKLTLSFFSSPWILRNGVLTSGESLLHRGLMALADVEGAKIHFKELVLSHQIASWDIIGEILVSHYMRQFLHEMYKIFGSAGVIGNPVGFARSLGLGIKDFLSLPMWSVFQSPSGLSTGMAQGTTSLLSNTVYAISDATSQFSRAAHKGIVAFTFDDQTATMIERQQKGMFSHSKGVINEFLEGLTGVLQSPIKGAEKYGLPGVLSGIAMGVTGLVARPAASILEVTGKTAQSIRNRSRVHQMGYRCFRVRLPRPLSAESPLKPYSWDEAVGTNILTQIDQDEALVTCKELNRSGEYVLITARHILVVSCPSLIGFDQPDFEGVPPDPNWEIRSEIGLDSVVLAEHDGEVVRIVGSGSDTSLFKQQQKRGNEKGKAWSNAHTPLPFVQTNMEFATTEEADELLRVLRGMIECGKEQGWGCKYIVHQNNIR